MFERFTEKAIKVIMLAQEEARRLGHNFVGTEQILLGLFGEGSGVAGKALRAQHLTLSALRLEVEKIIGRGTGFVAVEIPFTPRAARVLELSWARARQLGHNWIGTEHLMLALLDEGLGVAYRVLTVLKVDLAELEKDVIERSKAQNNWLNPTAEAQHNDLAQQAPIKYCPYCAEMIKSGAIICGFCSRDPDLAIKRCRHCRELIHPEAKLCRYCERVPDDPYKDCEFCGEGILSSANVCRYCLSTLTLPDASVGGGDV